MVSPCINDEELERKCLEQLQRAVHTCTPSHPALYAPKNTIQNQHSDMLICYDPVSLAHQSSYMDICDCDPPAMHSAESLDYGKRLDTSSTNRPRRSSAAQYGVVSSTSSRSMLSKHRPQRRSTLAASFSPADSGCSKRQEYLQRAACVYKTSMDAKQLAHALDVGKFGGKGSSELMAPADSEMCLQAFGYMDLLTLDNQTADQLGMLEMDLYQFKPESKVHTLQRKAKGGPVFLHQ